MQRIGAAAVYALIATLTALQTQGVPHTAEAWIGVAIIALTAGYGKYSSNTTWVGPDRVVWSPEQRKAETLTK